MYSPDFLIAVARVLNDEGGYVSDPSDSGGETNFGISKRSYPNEDIKGMTAERATEIYWNDFWLKYGFDKLKGFIAAKVFNLSVVMGASSAIICLQRALRACGVFNPAEDGVLALATVHTVNSCSNTEALLSALRSEAAGYFRTIAHDNAARTAFLKGWLIRAYR
jgi:lysozyme family protein